MAPIVAPKRYHGRRIGAPVVPRATPPPVSIRSVSRTPSRSPTPRRSVPQCQHCQSTVFENYEGQIICKHCGVIASHDGNFRAEVEFDEGPSGATKLRGTHIGANQTHATSYHSRVGAVAHVGGEFTPAIDNARRTAERVVSECQTLLGISVSDHHRAMSLFNAAYTRAFYRGRTLESVALVCTYLAVRKGNNKSLMLIDFAEVGNINVFQLGNMAKELQEKLYMGDFREKFLKNAQKSGMNEHRLLDSRWKAELESGKVNYSRTSEDHLNLVEPEHLIDRFCDKLDFGDKGSTDRVKNDAVKIARGMKREWMVDGRRPAGVAGAAVILAARMNNFRRTLREVVLVAKVTEMTLGKRIEEFKETKSSTLSVNEFRQVEPEQVISLQEAEDLGPPSKYRADPEWQAKQAQKSKRKRKRGGKKKGVAITAAEIENEDEETEAETEPEAEETEDDNDQNETTEDQADDRAEDVSAGDGPPPAKRPRIDADGFLVPDVPIRATSSSQKETTPQPRRSAGRPKGAKSWKPPEPTAQEIAEEQELEEDIRDQLRQNASLDPTASETDTAEDQETEGEASVPGVVKISYPGPSKSDPLGPAVNTNIGNLGNVCSMDETIAEDEFANDEDIMECLLTEEQRKTKEHYWVEENKDWLRSEHLKKIKRELKDRELREKGMDPEKERERIKNRKRKDGNRVSGRVGDVSYLEDQHKRNGQDAANGDGRTAQDGDGSQQGAEASTTRNAQTSARSMLNQRGVFSRRVDYDKLLEAYRLPGMDDSSEGDSQSRSESPATRPSDSDHFFRPSVGRGAQASMRRRARETMRGIGGYTTAAETDAETEAEDADQPQSRSLAGAETQDENENEDEDAEFEEDNGTPEATPIIASSAITQNRPTTVTQRQPKQIRRPRPQAPQLPTPSPTQPQDVSSTTPQSGVTMSADARAAVQEHVEGVSRSASTSPLSSTHTPTGYVSGGPNTPAATQQILTQPGTRQVPQEIGSDEEEAEEEDGAGDYWSGDEVEDEEDEEEEEEDLDRYFAGEGGNDADAAEEGVETMMGEEEVVEDD